MPRLVYWAGWALLLVAGAFLLTDALTWTPGVTERNARRVRPGMTLPEVEALLRGPAAGQGRWISASHPLLGFGMAWSAGSDYPVEGWQHTWRGAGFTVTVWFDL